MGNKVGRPPVPRREAKTILRGAMYSPEKLKQLEQARLRSGLDMSKFIREAVDMEIQGPPIWVKPNLKAEDLDEQYIEFSLRSKVPGGIRILEGVGKLKVRENKRGEMAVDIFVTEPQTPYRGITTRIWLSQEAVDRIELNPKPEPAKFRLLA